MTQAHFTIVRFQRTQHGIDRRHAFVVCSYPSMKEALHRCLRLNEPFTNWYYEIVALPKGEGDSMDLATRMRPVVHSASARPAA